MSSFELLYTWLYHKQQKSAKEKEKKGEEKKTSILPQVGVGIIYIYKFFVICVGQWKHALINYNVRYVLCMGILVLGRITEHFCFCGGWLGARGPIL